MGSFARTAGGIGAAILAGATLTTAPSVAQAQSPASGGRVTWVPCDAAQLSSAFAMANTAGSGTLRLSPHCVYNITATLTTSGTSRINLIGGPSTTVKRNPSTGNIRVFDVASGTTLRIEGIFIQNGELTGAGDGGGIRNAGTLIMSSVTLNGNTTNNGNGGGLANTGTALLAKTLVSANNTGLRSTTALNGGGIFNSGTLTLLESRVTGNVSNGTGAGGRGGGIYTDTGGTTRIIQSTIDHNNTSLFGGGIYNNGRTSLDRTLVQLNEAPDSIGAGGIYNNVPGGVTLRRSIVRRNSPDNCEPAGSVPGCLG